MGVTSNYSFPVPVATDLVKNGWDAINDLGVAVDTAMNTALATKKAGMVLLNTTSFTGVASQSVNDVFSATYDNYLILFNTTFNGSLTLTMRMRVSGADNSTSNYHYARNTLFSNATTAVTNAESQSSFDLSGPVTNFNSTMFIQKPFATALTTFTSNQVTTSATTPFTNIRTQGALFNATTSFTGFSVIASASNITGSISVYGVSQ
jgi:hypothetical protein